MEDYRELAINNLSKVIIELRGDRTQVEFAQILGVSKPTVQQWEYGSGNTPSFDNIVKIANLRDELPEELLAFLLGRTVTRSTDKMEFLEKLSYFELLIFNKHCGDLILEQQEKSIEIDNSPSRRRVPKRKSPKGRTLSHCSVAV